MAEAQGPGFVIRVYSCVKVTQEYDLIIARDPVDSGREVLVELVLCLLGERQRGSVGAH